jgi:hypothetical protein
LMGLFVMFMSEGWTGVVSCSWRGVTMKYIREITPGLCENWQF